MMIDHLIAEQPETLEAVLSEVPKQLAAIRPIRPARPLYFVGSGTSMNVLVATELEGRSFRELAAETGVNVNTLLSRKRYAVLHLRERLQNWYDEMTES